MHARRRLIYIVLLMIIIATLPCYCAGCLLLALWTEPPLVNSKPVVAPTMTQITINTTITALAGAHKAAVHPGL